MVRGQIDPGRAVAGTRPAMSGLAVRGLRPGMQERDRARVIHQRCGEMFLPVRDLHQRRQDGGLVALVPRREVVLQRVHVRWQLGDLAEHDGQVDRQAE